VVLPPNTGIFPHLFVISIDAFLTNLDKPGFQNREDVMPDYDVIVIGAGLGGLTSGALLAHQGRKVLVLEQKTGSVVAALHSKRMVTNLM